MRFTLGWVMTSDLPHHGADGESGASRRCGTADTCAHVTPAIQQSAAERLDRVYRRIAEKLLNLVDDCFAQIGGGMLATSLDRSRPSRVVRAVYAPPAGVTPSS
jgi:hypothetical protein